MDVSVIIPLYNKKGTVIRALDSVMRQTVYPKEIIVVNDGSTDGSGDVVGSCVIKGLRLVHQANAGVSAARNTGIKEAASEWLAFLDADDEWLPEYLETLSELHLRYPQCDVLASAYLFGKHAGETWPMAIQGIGFNDDGVLSNYFQVAASSDPPLCSSAVCVRKSAMLAIGGFPEGVTAGEDLLTWARLAATYEIAYSTLPLAVFWQDLTCVYQGRPSRIPQHHDPVGQGLKIIANSGGNIRAIKHYRAHWHKMRASIYLRLDMRNLAVAECFKSLWLHPFNPRVLVYMFLSTMPASTVQAVFKRFGS